MSWPLFDRIRMLFRQGRLYQPDQILQNQPDISRISANNEFINFSQQQSILNQTNLQINRLERYKDFDQMDEVGEITLALDMYSDESTVTDSEHKHAFSIKAEKKAVREELEDLFYNVLMLDNTLRPMVRYLCKYGDFASEVIPTHNRDAIASIRFMNMYNFTRVETPQGDLVGFFYQNELKQSPLFLHPWQVMHLRLTSYENIFQPYGLSILQGARKAFKELRLMEDAAIIYRLSRGPERRVFKIPVGNIPAQEVAGYIENIARQIKKRQYYDPATNKTNERYSPLLAQDDYWLPVRADGSGPEVTQLEGAKNLNEIEDIEYFKKKMIAGLKIPFSRVGIGDPSDLDGKTLSQTSPDFAKAVQWIQREVVVGLKKIALIHLALKGFVLEDIRNFEIIMTASSAIDELYRIETWNSRADVIDALRGTGIISSDWILKHFTDMSSDEIIEMKKTLAIEKKEEAAAEESDLKLEQLDRELKQLTEQLKSPSPIIAKTKYFNGIQTLINNGELDGLRLDDQMIGQEFDDENKQLISESKSTAKQSIKEEIQEFLEIQKEKLKVFDVVIEDDAEITEKDLP